MERASPTRSAPPLGNQPEGYAPSDQRNAHRTNDLNKGHGALLNKRGRLRGRLPRVSLRGISFPDAPEPHGYHPEERPVTPVDRRAGVPVLVPGVVCPRRCVGLNPGMHTQHREPGSYICVHGGVRLLARGAFSSSSSGLLQPPLGRAGGMRDALSQLEMRRNLYHLGLVRFMGKPRPSVEAASTSRSSHSDG